MSGVARGGSTPRSNHQRLSGQLGSPGNLFSQKIRGKEDELLNQKITSRLVEVEKDGTEIIKDIEKLRTQVEVMLEDARFIVDDFKSMENPRKCYQHVSQRLLEVEDGIPMLAACISQWQSSFAASSEFNATSNYGDSSRYLVTESVQDPDGPIEPEQDGRDGDHNFLDGSAISSEGPLEEKEIKAPDNVLTEKPRQEVSMNKIREIGTNEETKDQKQKTEFKKPCSSSIGNVSISSMEKRPSSVMKASASLPLTFSNSDNDSEIATENINVKGTADLSFINPNQDKLELGLISKSDNEKSVVRSSLNKPCLLPSRGQNDEKGKSNSTKNCQASDRNNNLATEEKSPGSVVMIYNLNPQFMDCDRLFNLISPYAQVKSIKFLKIAEFRKAMIELNNKEGAQRVMKFMKDEMVFGKTIRFEPSPKLRVTEFNPDQCPSLPNGTKAFKDFSRGNQKNYLQDSRSSTMYPPSRTIYFCKTPKMSDEDLKGIFEKLKAPVPYKIMWFPSYGGMGCLQFKTKEEALKAMCIANLALTKSGRRVHLAFTYQRKDGDFCRKMEK